MFPLLFTRYINKFMDKSVMQTLKKTRSALRKMPPFYAVASGRKPGIYNTWNECSQQVHGYSNPIFKKFSTYSQAQDFIRANSGSSRSSNSSSRSSSSSSSSYGYRVEHPQKTYALGKSRTAYTEVDMGTSSYDYSGRGRKDEFNVDADGYVNVYTDGACQKNGQYGAKAGIGVWFGDDHPLNISEPLEGIATNNKAEINAVIAAAKQAKKAGITKLKINTDSQFLISCITEWMHKWKRNGWRTNTGPVKNKAELLEMEEALRDIDVIWHHVNGHVGVYGNEMADKLARNGCATYKPPN